MGTEQLYRVIGQVQISTKVKAMTQPSKNDAKKYKIVCDKIVSVLRTFYYQELFFYHAKKGNAYEIAENKVESKNLADFVKHTHNAEIDPRILDAMSTFFEHEGALTPSGWSYDAIAFHFKKRVCNDDNLAKLWILQGLFPEPTAKKEETPKSGDKRKRDERDAVMIPSKSVEEHTIFLLTPLFNVPMHRSRHVGWSILA